jgi:hypothetical protein
MVIQLIRYGAARTMVEAVAQACRNTTEKIKAYFCDHRHTGVERRQ